MTYKSDCELLGLDPNIEIHDPSFVKEKFRELALKLHPDIGGDRERFEAVRDAYKRIHEQCYEQWSKCPDCKGSGNVELRSGWQTIRQSCARCCGTGKRP